MTEPVFSAPTDGFSDDEWRALVAAASDGERHHFTENRLYAEYARGRVVISRYISRRGKLGLAMIAIGIAIWVYGLKIDWGLMLVGGIAITLGGVAQVGTGVVTRRDPAAREPMRRWLEKWLSVQALPELLRAPALAHAGLEYAPPTALCVLVVERDILVDLLLKNGAQQRLQALIVAESGYPEALAREAQRQLDERSELKVIALHDATERGIGLNARLRSSRVLSVADREIVDAGLFAAEVGQIAELNSAFPPSHATQVPVDALSYPTLLAGLAGVVHGARTLTTGIFENDETPRSRDAERAA
ncbi:MAG TPA: hypothetical protein VHV51_16340 [Polyangiaceae bacterium]|nr:hypothetical protein [Polyangiaceae bacterium]